jgi:hypothetical protein
MFKARASKTLARFGKCPDDLRVQTFGSVATTDAYAEPAQTAADF